MTQAVINPEAAHRGRQASFSRLGSLEKMVKLSQSCEYPLLSAMELLSTFQNQLVPECLQMGLDALHESPRLENCTFTLQPKGTEGKIGTKTWSTTTSHCWGLAQQLLAASVCPCPEGWHGE